MTESCTVMMSREALELAVSDAFPIVFERLKNRYRDAQLAEEVSIDCMEKAFEKWREDPCYFVQHDLAEWTSRRAGWRAIDRLRQRTRHVPLPDENPHDDDRPSATGPVNYHNDADRRLNERLRTWEALQKLDELDRRVLIGHFYDGRSDQELGAELFGESGSQTARGLRVWRIRQRAQARLRSLLLAEGIDPGDYAGQAV